MAQQSVDEVLEHRTAVDQARIDFDLGSARLRLENEKAQLRRCQRRLYDHGKFFIACDGRGFFDSCALRHLGEIGDALSRRDDLEREIRDSHFACREYGTPLVLLLTGEVLW